MLIFKNRLIEFFREIWQRNYLELLGIEAELKQIFFKFL